MLQEPGFHGIAPIPMSNVAPAPLVLVYDSPHSYEDGGARELSVAPPYSYGAWQGVYERFYGNRGFLVRRSSG